MNDGLGELFTKYGTDKGIWGYTPAYERWLGPRRNIVTNVLEIGICGQRDIPNNVTGASLHVWRDYFPHAFVYGVDIDPKWMVNKTRILSMCCDAYDPEKLDATLNQHMGYASLDFICDDAVHDPMPQVNLLQSLWPRLTPGGIYAIEDVCPYKMPNGDIKRMLDCFPRDATDVLVFETHKDERLILIQKRGYDAVRPGEHPSHTPRPGEAHGGASPATRTSACAGAPDREAAIAA